MDLTENKPEPAPGLERGDAYLHGLTNEESGYCPKCGLTATGQDYTQGEDGVVLLDLTCECGHEWQIQSETWTRRKDADEEGSELSVEVLERERIRNAAPSLLAALEEMRAAQETLLLAVEESADDWTRAQARAEAADNAARAAIAQARGEGR